MSSTMLQTEELAMVNTSKGELDISDVVNEQEAHYLVSMNSKRSSARLEAATRIYFYPRY